MVIDEISKCYTFSLNLLLIVVLKFTTHNYRTDVDIYYLDNLKKSHLHTVKPLNPRTFTN